MLSNNDLNTINMLCDCPVSSTLPDIVDNDCPNMSGQVQMLAFQRINSASGVLNSFVILTNSIKTKASWTAKKTAADSTKIVISPYINAPTFEPGAAKTFGSGNEILNAIPMVVGKDPTKFTSKLLNRDAAVVSALKSMQCEELGVYLFNEAGQIGCIVDNTTTPTLHKPVPIHSLFVGDKKIGGIEAPDENEMSFSLVPNWDNNFVWVKPTDFDPRNLRETEVVGS
jgi:hypothetical protein